MDNLEEDIITEDPKPRPKLLDKHRAQLDSIVMRMAANNEPEENIRAVVDDFKSKYAAPEPKAFQIQISQPTFTSAPAATGPKAFTGASEIASSGQFSTEGSRETYGVEKLKGKARAAKEKLDLELHSNDTQYEQKLRELRRDTYNLEDLKKEYKQNGQIIPIGQEKEVLRAAKQRQYELPVTPEDISDMKMGTILNTDISRKFIRDLDKPEVQKNAYLVDAYNRAAQDVNGNERAAKIKDNADKIGKKLLTYDPVYMVLGRPEGFVNSLFTGRTELNKSFDLYEYIKNKPTAAVLDKLNHEINTDIDEPVSVPAGKIAGIGRMMGEQPLKGLIGGGIAAIATTAAGQPEAASTAFNLVSAGLSGIDAYKITFANATKANYAAFKQQGLSDQEAFDKAKALAEDQANTDAASAVLMSAAAGKMAFKPTGLTLSTLRKSLGSALTQIGEAGGKKALEGFGIGAVGGVSQIIKNVQAQNAGLPIEATEGVKEQVEAGVLLTAATHVIAKASASLKPSTLNKLARAVSSAPKEITDNAISSQQEQGHITPEEAKRAQDVINDTRAMNEAIPKDIPEIDREAIAAKIKERNELKAKLETIDELYHPEIKEKIKKLNEDALAISKGAARADLHKLITKEVNDGNVDKSASDMLMSATEKELEGYMKDIAAHANNPETEQMTLSVFGKAIVDKAKELYPKEKIEPQNITQDASNVRSDEGQVPLGRTEPASGQEQGGSNIQLEEGVKPIPPETEQQAGNTQQQQDKAEGEEVAHSKMEGGIPPEMFDLPFIPEDPDVNRLAHADTEQIYKDLGMADRAPRATKDDITLEKEADALIRNGYDFEGKADRVLSGRDKSFTDAEQVAFAKMVGALNVKLRGLRADTPEFRATYETIERLSRASDKAGSEEGAAFRARRMFVLNDETLSSFIKQAQDANLDVPLSDEQMTAVKERFDKVVAERDKYKARVEQLMKDRKRAKAEEKVKESKPASSTKKAREDYVKERKDIIEQMRKDLLKVAKGGGGALATIPGAPQLKAIAPHVAKLLKSLLEEGIDNFGDLVKNIHDQVKDYVDGVKEDDIIDIIAGEYSNKQTRSDIQNKIYEMHLQAKLINRLEALQAGIQPKNKRQRLIRSAEIESLRKQIKELEGRPEKTEAERLAALKARYKSQTEKLQKKINEGDFEPDEKEIIALDKEATELKDAYIKTKIEWQKQVAKDAFNNRSLKDKSKDWAAEILGIPRTVMSSMDLSAPLRQGLVLTTSHPIIASRAFKESLKQAIDPARFDRWLYDLKQSDFYKNVIEKSGLYIADPNNLHLSVKEEAYMSNLAEKIPIVGDTIKTKEGKTILPGLGLISKSERAYVSYLNKLRVDVFTMYAKGFAEKGMTPENRPDVYEALGAFINAATGRGELGDLERSAPILNALFFSPRLIASRLNLLNPVFYASLPKEVRVMAIKDMAKMIGLGATTVGLLSLVPGVTTELNPTSPDFGKIKVGNTRWDVWGGFQQYIRLASQLISGYEKKANGNIVPLGPARNQNTKADKFFSFFRGKLSPVPSLIVDYGTGKTAVGEDVELTSEMKEHLIPMIGNDVMDAWKEQGPMSLVYTGIPSFLGVGTTTYKERESGAPKGKPQKNTKNTRNTKR